MMVNLMRDLSSRDFLQDKVAEESFCRVCGAALWKAQWCGFSVFSDCTPIDTKTEIECFLTKRPTYGVSRWSPSFYLEHRSMLNIHKQYEFILAKHLCGSTQAVKEHLTYWVAPKQLEPNF
jgi:hypothetical protein